MQDPGVGPGADEFYREREREGGHYFQGIGDGGVPFFLCGGGEEFAVEAEGAQGGVGEVGPAELWVFDVGVWVGHCFDSEA